MIVRMRDINVIAIFFVSIELLYTVSADKSMIQNYLWYCFMFRGNAERLFNLLLYIDAIWPQILVNISAGHGLLPDGNKPLSEPISILGHCIEYRTV